MVFFLIIFLCFLCQRKITGLYCCTEKSHSQTKRIRKTDGRKLFWKSKKITDGHEGKTRTISPCCCSWEAWAVALEMFIKVFDFCSGVGEFHFLVVKVSPSQRLRTTCHKHYRKVARRTWTSPPPTEFLQLEATTHGNVMRHAVGFKFYGITRCCKFSPCRMRSISRDLLYVRWCNVNAFKSIFSLLSAHIYLHFVNSLTATQIRKDLFNTRIKCDQTFKADENIQHVTMIGKFCSFHKQNINTASWEFLCWINKKVNSLWKMAFCCLLCKCLNFCALFLCSAFYEFIIFCLI